VIGRRKDLIGLRVEKFGGVRRITVHAKKDVEGGGASGRNGRLRESRLGFQAFSMT
jgi:hypothetical protein